MTMSTTYAESTLPLALQTVRPSPMRRWWAGRRLTLEHRIEIYRYLARELRLGAQLIEAVAGLFWIYSDEGQRIRHPIAVATRSWLPRLREREPLVEVRSEEHTSELQSLMRSSYAVFRLKKTNRADN